MTSELRVLLVDDDDDDYVLFQEMVQDIHRWVIQLAWISRSGTHLAQEICTGEYDVALVEYRFGTDSGIELIQECFLVCPDVPTVLVTDWQKPGIEQEALQAGARGYAQKSQLDAAGLEALLLKAVGGGEGGE